MKKRSEATQTLRAGCSKAEPKNFAPPQTPFPDARDGQNLISWRWLLLLPTNPVWWGSMHAISSYRGNRPTNKQTQPQTHTPTWPITIHCAPASAQCKHHRFLVLCQAWTGHCAVAQAPPSTNTCAPWPLRNFLIIMVTISVDRQHYR